MVPIGGRMHALKMFLLFVLGGAPLGATAASFLAPPLVKMRYAPSGEAAALCNCKDLADEMVASLFQAQLIGLVIGAVLGLVLFVMLRRAGKLRKPKPPESRPPEGSPGPDTPEAGAGEVPSPS